MNRNQRKCERRIPKGNVYAALGRNYAKVGKIIDISQGGLSFVCVSNEDKQVNFSRVNIFAVGDVFHLYNFPCLIVYDISISPQDVRIESFQRSSTQRYGVQFLNLAEEDNAQLALFLTSHTKAAS